MIQILTVSITLSPRAGSLAFCHILMWFWPNVVYVNVLWQHLFRWSPGLILSCLEFVFWCDIQVCVSMGTSGRVYVLVLCCLLSFAQIY